MSPSLVERSREEHLRGLSPDLWGLSPEGGVEVGDVAAEEGFFKGWVAFVRE